MRRPSLLFLELIAKGLTRPQCVKVARGLSVEISEVPSQGM